MPEETPPYQIETLPNGTPVHTSSHHSVGTDALLLARFCAPRQNWAACDLGTGCGVIALSLWDDGVRGGIVGVEQNAEAAGLFRAAAAKLGGNAPIEVVEGDIREYRPNRLFDLVVCNPPYFTSGQTAADPARATARHQQTGTIWDFCATASRLLKDRARFAVCYPPAKLAELFAACEANRLAPKRMQLVRTRAQDPPWLVLLEARKADGVGLTLLPDCILPPGQPVRY